MTTHEGNGIQYRTRLGKILHDRLDQRVRISIRNHKEKSLLAVVMSNSEAQKAKRARRAERQHTKVKKLEQEHQKASADKENEQLAPKNGKRKAQYWKKMRERQRVQKQRKRDQHKQQEGNKITPTPPKLTTPSSTPSKQQQGQDQHKQDDNDKTKNVLPTTPQCTPAPLPPQQQFKNSSSKSHSRTPRSSAPLPQKQKVEKSRKNSHSRPHSLPSIHSPLVPSPPPQSTLVLSPPQSTFVLSPPSHPTLGPSLALLPFPVLSPLVPYTPPPPPQLPSPLPSPSPPPSSRSASTSSSPNITSPKVLTREQIRKLQPFDGYYIQPQGDYCLVCSRDSSPKGQKTENGKQIDIDGKVEDQKKRGRILAKRLSKYAPISYRFEKITCCHFVKQSSDFYRFDARRKNSAANVKEVQTFCSEMPEDKKLTILVRGIDGLTTNQDTFISLLTLLDKISVQIIFQYSSIDDRTRHPRLRPFQGLASAMAFSKKEFLDHFQKRVINPDVERILEIWRKLDHNKAKEADGIRTVNFGRNRLPSKEEGMESNKM